MRLPSNRNCLIRGPPEFCLGWMAMAQVKFKISHVNVTYASAQCTYIHRLQLIKLVTKLQGHGSKWFSPLMNGLSPGKEEVENHTSSLTGRPGARNL